MGIITYPTLPLEETQESRCCYSFHRFLKLVDQQNETLAVYQAIHLTAQETGYSDMYVAKILVEYGLKAPKEAFPESFSHFLEEKTELNPWAAGSMSYAQNKLAKFWQLSIHFDMLKKHELVMN